MFLRGRCLLLESLKDTSRTFSSSFRLLEACFTQCRYLRQQPASTLFFMEDHAIRTICHLVIQRRERPTRFGNANDQASLVVPVAVTKRGLYSLTMRPSDPWHCARRCNWSSEQKDTARLANGWCRGRHVPAPRGGASDTMLLSSTQPSVSCLPRCTLEGTDLTSCFPLSAVSSSPVALVKFFPFAASALSRLRRYGIRCMFRDVVSFLSSPPNPPSGSSRSRLPARFPHFVTTEWGALGVSRMWSTQSLPPGST